MKLIFFWGTMIVMLLKPTKRTPRPRGRRRKKQGARRGVLHAHKLSFSGFTTTYTAQVVSNSFLFGQVFSHSTLHPLRTPVA
jgi:hypothetical protein